MILLATAIASTLAPLVVAAAYSSYSPTETRLLEDIAKMKQGRVATTTAKHILGEYKQAYKKNPELFSFGKPERLTIEETKELAWSVQINVWNKAEDKNDNFAAPAHSEPILFHEHKRGVIKPYIY